VTCDGSGFQTLVRECSTGDNRDCENQGGHWWQVVPCDNGPCVFGEYIAIETYLIDNSNKLFDLWLESY